MLGAHRGCGEEVGKSSWSTAEWVLLPVLPLTSSMSSHLSVSVALASELQVTMLNDS